MMTTETLKRCSKCKEVKPISAFYRKRSTKDGLNRLCKPCWKKPKLKPEPEPVIRQRRPILVPLKPVSIVCFAEPEPEPKRIEPKIDIDAEKATREELAEFVKQFVVEYITKNGETADEFFRHWINHKYPEITQESVTRAISGLIKSNQVKVTRWETPDLSRVNFLALA